MLRVVDRGLEAYNISWQAMRDHIAQCTDSTPDELWLLEHEPVYTLGQSSNCSHILQASDIPIVHSDRGGQITYHGPGQLIAYVLINLKRANLGVRSLVTLLEQSIIGTLKHYHITANSKDKAPGVYVQDKKIASIGLRIRRGFSYHGLALNICGDLGPFERINPCGFEGLEMITLSDLVADIHMDSVKTLLVKQLKEHLSGKLAP